MKTTLSIHLTRNEGKRCLDKPREWRQERARKASAASRRARRLRAVEAAERYPTKADAYAAGYRTGYSAAMRWWKWRAERMRRAS